MAHYIRPIDDALRIGGFMVVEPTKRAAPYLPFTTFMSSFDVFSQGVPPRLDRSLWRSQSGLVQGQIMNAYRFFGLVVEEEGDTSTEELVAMAKKTEQRPQVLRGLIESQFYEMLETHDLTKMTMKMLEDEFEKHFSVSGTTKQKAIAFFLKAAKFADMPLSTFLQSQLRNTGARKRRGRQRGDQQNGAEDSVEEDVDTQNRIPTGAISHSVVLASGGTLTVVITANPFAMPTDDRAFVFSMIDMVQNYEKNRAAKDADK
jgi:hypothetical protein